MVNGQPPLKAPDRLRIGGGQSVKRLFEIEANATNPVLNGYALQEWFLPQSLIRSTTARLSAEVLGTSLLHLEL